MKKITFKISTFLLLTMFALQLQGQACPEIYTVDGSYLISTCGETPELYLTIDGSTGDLVWAAEIGSNDPTQVWTIQDHVNPSGTGFVQITANVPGPGDFTMIVDQSTIDPMDANDKDFRISVRTGVPIADAGDPNYGFDQFQRRRTAGFGGPGNDALFVKPLGASGGSRYGITPTAAGEDVLFDGGGIDGLRFVLIAALSTADFDTTSIFISNPVNNELSIKGLPAEVKQVSVYSLLGREVLTQEVDGRSDLNMGVTTLASGMYLVEMRSDRGSYTKKIVKQ
tara:strand:- start:1499 stop:2347 length:849 start_codon:yes stop_codon:yes gene_type:complete